MNISYVVKGVPVYGSTKERINKKVAKVDKYFDSDAEALLKISQISKSKKVKVEISVKTDKLETRSQEIDDNIMSAVTSCIADIERQIRKHKTRIEKRMRDAGIEQEICAEEAEDANTNVVREKHIIAKPMTVDEAIDQMDMLAHDFFMFRNGTTGQICTVYHRYDGGYGLINIE